MPLRSCAVMRPVVSVQVLQRDGWIDGVVGGATKIDVDVRGPVTRHTVTMQ